MYNAYVHMYNAYVHMYNAYVHMHTYLYKYLYSTETLSTGVSSIEIFKGQNFCGLLKVPLVS